MLVWTKPRGLRFLLFNLHSEHDEEGVAVTLLVT
jgi:hypothetical protein